MADKLDNEIQGINAKIADIDKKIGSTKPGKQLDKLLKEKNKLIEDRNKKQNLKEAQQRITSKESAPAVSSNAVKAAAEAKVRAAGGTPVTNKTTPAPKTTSGNSGGNSYTSSAEKRLGKVEQKARDLADEMNSEDVIEQKTKDANSAAKTAKERASQIDANIEENVPTWFWREAEEMAPTDKAKRGFIVANHILNRLGTATGNIGAIIQNAGGSGGAQLNKQGGSYIDQYRQSKIEQALSNRKSKQNSLLQQQIDALISIGVPENEARAIQNRLRNSKYWNKYNRLTNEQQVYIQSLMYKDAAGELSDAVLGSFIDQLMEGKNVSLDQLATSVLTAYGIDNIGKIKSGAADITKKVTDRLGWKKYGE